MINFRFSMWHGHPGRVFHGLEARAMFRFLWVPLVGVLFFSVGARLAPEHGDPSTDTESPTVIVIVGATGSPEYGAQFVKWARLWEQACSKGGAKFAAIGLDEVQNPDDRTALQQMLAGESQETAAALWLVMIGHGTFDGRTAKFNL